MKMLQADADRSQDEAKKLSELAAIVSNSDDPILSKNLDGVITSWNAAAVRVLGYAPEEIIGRSILTLIPPELHAHEGTILDRIRAGERIEHYETVRLTKSGQLIDVSLTVSPIRDKSGCIVGASKILRDISARKRMEQSLLQAEKIAATGRMAATIAHEINNPLEAIVNLLYLLRPLVTDAEGKRYLATAESELVRVSHIAKQTLGYYREHSSPQPTSLTKLVEETLQVYESRCMAFQIKIEKHLRSKGIPMLRRGEILQVISNLIVNSIHAMPQGGVLRLCSDDISQPEPGVLLRIEDTGIGIPPENLPRIFEAFFTTRNAIGTGIGLFVARQFVEGHGGRISVSSSTAEDSHGTSIEVFLPLLLQEPVAQPSLAI